MIDVLKRDLNSCLDGMAGLVEAKEILTGVKGIHFAYFTEKDVVRHPLVQDIIRAYETLGRGRNANGAGGAGGREEKKEPAGGENSDPK